MSEAFGSTREFIYLHSGSNQGKTPGFINKNKLVENLKAAIILTDKPSIKEIPVSVSS